MLTKNRVFILVLIAISLLIATMLVTTNIFSENKNENDNYDIAVHYISNEFEMKHYTEVLQTDDYHVGVPDSFNGIESNKDINIYNSSKNFIYKNSEKSMIITLAISKNNDNQSEWISASGYNPKLHNFKGGAWGYEDNLPETAIFTYVVGSEGYTLTISGLSKNDTDGSITLNELALFTQELTNKLKENNG
ncbi:hypothetical protein [Longirhabdus pacifica]|uniref:hypothetical protein n=1 Tax=Longirhabdus pacifica TaxID=2305227 RepID=UPI001008A07C|nr:hypothetical protein [Longirhabdus pacifica]